MVYKQTLGALGVTGLVHDLGALDDKTPPPFSFDKDLQLGLMNNFPVTYKSPDHDTYSYFAPGGP